MRGMESDGKKISPGKLILDIILVAGILSAFQSIFGKGLFLTSLPQYSYLDPDPLLLATRRGKEGNISNPRFHALNQAVVQLVSQVLSAFALVLNRM